MWWCTVKIRFGSLNLMPLFTISDSLASNVIHVLGLSRKEGNFSCISVNNVDFPDLGVTRKVLQDDV